MFLLLRTNRFDFTNMFRYIQRYPVSLAIILVISYLSFFKPPKTELSTILGLDKAVHLCMYLGMSGMLWWEFLRAHRKEFPPLWHAWVGATLCPILFGGGMELLQAYCTTHRSGDWLDFAANIAGVLLASFIGYFILRPRIIGK